MVLFIALIRLRVNFKQALYLVMGVLAVFSGLAGFDECVDDLGLISIISFEVADLCGTGSTEQNFTLSFNWMGKELQLGSFLVLQFSLLSDSIGIYDSKYPNANSEVENSVIIGVCG